MNSKIIERPLFEFVRVSPHQIIIRRYDPETDTYRKLRQCHSLSLQDKFVIIDDSLHYIHNGELLIVSHSKPCRFVDFQTLFQSGDIKLKVLDVDNPKLPFKKIVRYMTKNGSREFLAEAVDKAPYLRPGDERYLVWEKKNVVIEFIKEYIGGKVTIKTNIL